MKRTQQGAAAPRINRVESRTEKNGKESTAPASSAERSGISWAAGTLLVALCTAIIYWQTVLVPPIEYEDPFYLVHSPYVSVTVPFSHLGSVWNEPYFANFHPVTTSSWLVDRVLADKSESFDARPFRISQLIYAVIGACLLILLYRRLKIQPVLAVLGALLYAVHPVHTEVVAWLSARKDLISLIFILLAFLAWLRAREATTPNEWRLWHALTILFTLLAVLSKPVAVILPALFVAYEFWVRDHLAHDKKCRAAGAKCICLSELHLVVEIQAATCCN
jgi:protein O-mannosyl-transferase